MISRCVFLFIGLLLALAGTNASALIQPVGGFQGQVFGIGPDATGPTMPTQAEACTALPAALALRWATVFGYKNPSAGSFSWDAQGCSITVTSDDGTAGNLGRSQISIVPVSSSQCPVNSTAVSGGCKCDTGFDEVGSVCKPHIDQCAGQTGRTGVLNWTEGYTRTPDEGDRKAVGSVYSPPSSGNICMGSCAVSLQTSGPGVQPLVSQAPTAQGLYRRSVDYPYVGLGTSCNPGTADVGADQNAPPPDCPGTVGEYSGKPVCVGTAAKPVTTGGMPQAPGSTPIAGNPTAGDKPATGEGSGSGSSGRTPSNGDGTAKGGPADAGKGGKGGEAGGTADGQGIAPKPPDGKEQAACGAPGQPECSVRVNEKGTPDGVGTTYDTAKAKLDETKGKNDEQLAKASGTGDKGFFEPVRSMFWAPPIAACETFDLPQQVGGLKLDACGVVDGVRTAMAFVWAGAGLFLCLGMIKRSF